MKDKEIKKLIEEWEQISKATAPSSELFADQSENNEVIKEMSFISGRKEFWEPIVCLTAYDQEPSNTLSSDEMISTISHDIKNRSYSAKTNEFLDYCENFITIPRGTITNAMDVIFSVAETEQVKNLMEYTSRIAECEKLFGDDPIKLLECLKKP